jgi:hypothetical protein
MVLMAVFGHLEGLPVVRSGDEQTVDDTISMFKALSREQQGKDHQINHVPDHAGETPNFEKDSIDFTPWLLDPDLPLDETPRGDGPLTDVSLDLEDSLSTGQHWGRVKKAFKSVHQAAKKTVQKIGRAMKKTASKVGKAIKKAVHHAGKFARKVGSSVVKAAGKLADKVMKGMSSKYPASSLSPVILVPGLASSRLRGRIFRQDARNKKLGCKVSSKNSRLWFSAKLLSPWHKDCILYTMEGKYDAKHHRFRSRNDTTVVVPHFGDTTAFEALSDILGLDVGSSIWFNYVHMLEFYGYKKGRDLWGAPYDFRLIPGYPSKGSDTLEFFKKLRVLTEDVYDRTGGKRVTYITHSLGGVVTKMFLGGDGSDDLTKTWGVSAAWRAKYVDTFLPVGAPFGGAVESIQAVVSGSNPGIPFAKPTEFHALLSHTTGVLATLTDANLSGENPRPICRFDGKEYINTPQSIYKLLKASNNSATADVYIKSIVPSRALLKAMPDFHTNVMVAYKLPTVEYVQYSTSQTSQIIAHHRKAKIKVQVACNPGAKPTSSSKCPKPSLFNKCRKQWSNHMGDGTVPQASGEYLPKQWVKHDKRNQLQRFRCVVHRDMISDMSVMNAMMKQVVKGFKSSRFRNFKYKASLAIAKASMFTGLDKVQSKVYNYIAGRRRRGTSGKSKWLLEAKKTSTSKATRAPTGSHHPHRHNPHHHNPHRHNPHRHNPHRHSTSRRRRRWGRWGR